jgi:hypothetical protein
MLVQLTVVGLRCWLLREYRNHLLEEIDPRMIPLNQQKSSTVIAVNDEAKEEDTQSRCSRAGQQCNVLFQGLAFVFVALLLGGIVIVNPVLIASICFVCNCQFVHTCILSCVSNPVNPRFYSGCWVQAYGWQNYPPTGQFVLLTYPSGHTQRILTQCVGAARAPGVITWWMEVGGGGHSMSDVWGTFFLCFRTMP